ncbi:hypothetical protein AVEN_13384-1, partial [Araneus ventricosus]
MERCGEEGWISNLLPHTDPILIGFPIDGWFCDGMSSLSHLSLSAPFFP